LVDAELREGSTFIENRKVTRIQSLPEGMRSNDLVQFIHRFSFGFGRGARNYQNYADRNECASSELAKAFRWLRSILSETDALSQL